MPDYQVLFTPTSNKDLKRLDKITQKKVNKAILRMQANPFAANVSKLVNHPEAKYRMRIGDWRILFNVTSESIYIIHIWPRGKNYKK